ncbi:MAG: cell wall-active antibiotics response protein [Chloroflexi bacterium]|nr:cell wall-active antibiotics response protein [Chloroflexota bacterium]
MPRAPFWVQLLAIFLIALGVVLLLNSLGIRLVSVGDVVLGTLAVLLIIAGVYLLRRSRRVRREPFYDIFLGRLQWPEPGWQVQETVFNLGIGELVVDLTKAVVPEGEHRLSLDCLIGQIRVLAPQGLALSVHAQVTLGTVVALGQRAEGVARTLEVATPGYQESPRRVTIDASLVIGEVRVAYAP